MNGIVIKGQFLMTRNGLKKNWGLRVEGKRIAQVGPWEELKEEDTDQVILLKDQMILPGFVNGHDHMYGVLSHGITVESLVTDFSDFLSGFWWPWIENRIDQNLAELTAEWACIQMTESGVTAFADILEGPYSIPGGLRSEERAVRKAGVRGFLSFEACERVSWENGQEGLNENEDFIKRCNKNKEQGDDLIQGFMSIHTLFTCTPSFIKQAKKIAKENHCLFHMHLSESDFEPVWSQKEYAARPVKVYENMDVLDEQILASQVVQATEEELDILADHKVKVVTMPLSNCEVGGGIAPVPVMLEKGLHPCLGTDGYIDNFFEVMRGAFLIHKANQKDPQVMSARQVYKMATEYGAEALGIDAGVLEEGRLADLITVRTDTPTPVNEHNVYDQLILFRNPSDVVYVMVDGKILKEDGRLVRTDKETVRKKLSQAAEMFWKADKK